MQGGTLESWKLGVKKEENRPGREEHDALEKEE